MLSVPLTRTAVWSETARAPDVLADVLGALDGDGAEEVVTLLRRARRVVVTGNGAALYAGHHLWLTSLAHPGDPEVVVVPAGVLGAGAVAWRDGDLPLVVSSSGELRDLVELLPEGIPPFVALTATPRSTLGAAARARVVVPVLTQDAVTHTQAYLGNVLAALLLWDRVAGAGLRDGLAELPERVAGLVASAPAAARELAENLPGRPTAGVVLGTAGGWTAALEGALLLKEVAGVPAEGLEAREAATTGSYALAPGHVVVGAEADDDRWAREALEVARAHGAVALGLPAATRAPALLLPFTTFPVLLALAGELGLRAGLDVDRPAWTDAYYATARTATPGPA